MQIFPCSPLSTPKPGAPRDRRPRTLLAIVGLAVASLASACGGADSDDELTIDSGNPPLDARAGDGGSWDGAQATADADPSAGADALGDAIAALCDELVPNQVVDVSVADLHQRITDGDPLAVVDVREVAETASGIIEGSLNYPWNSGVLAAEHQTLPDDVPLFVICRSGSRSAQASQFLANNGHLCVHNVLGGMTAWTNAGYPTVPP